VSGTDGFVHLRVRSAYSLLEGAIKAEGIAKLAAAAEMPAVALTDRANLLGPWNFRSCPRTPVFSRLSDVSCRLRA